jgi:hypothetical protein
VHSKGARKPAAYTSVRPRAQLQCAGRPTPSTGPQKLAAQPRLPGEARELLAP